MLRMDAEREAKEAKILWTDKAIASGKIPLEAFAKVSERYNLDGVLSTYQREIDYQRQDGNPEYQYAFRNCPTPPQSALSCIDSQVIRIISRTVF